LQRKIEEVTLARFGDHRTLQQQWTFQQILQYCDVLLGLQLEQGCEEASDMVSITLLPEERN